MYLCSVRGITKSSASSAIWKRLEIEITAAGAGLIAHNIPVLGISDSGRLQVDWFYFIFPGAPFHLSLSPLSN